MPYDLEPQLPITEHADEIARLIRDHQVVIVAGETGSGKTTQLPKICLNAGRRRIGHTQPRRLAARSVAQRIADEIGTPLGCVVGYQVRFTNESSRATRVKLMTDGIMLAEITHDRELRRYDTIIIDEAHERSLNIVFLLGYLKQLLPKRPELRVIITSATIDTQRFSERFGDAPIVEVSGRSYPVEVRYRPLGEADEQADGIVTAAVELLTEGDGDILVFCSGEREIKDALKALEDADLDVDLLPLHSRLSAAEQHRIFTAGRRRIIVSTNIAETSLTVPGIRYVIDAGTARISRYSARTKVQRLPIEPISQASANQRAGRCGRVAPGVCIRLYSEDGFLTRPEFTEPEILRTNLASVILAMAKARLGDIVDFPFVDAPDSGQISDGLRLLRELRAIRSGRHVSLTRTGHALAELPIDPRLARMLVEAQRRGCLRDVLVIASFLAIQDPRERPAEKREAADALHARFFSEEADPQHSASGPPKRHTAHTSAAERARDHDAARRPSPGGDIIAIVRLWRYLQRSRKRLSGNQFRKMCRAEYINFLRYREWQDLHSQLRTMCTDHGWKLGTGGDDEATLQCVLSGLLSHIGVALEPPARQRGRRRGPAEYLGARGARFAIQPGSALGRSHPPLVMAVELVETSRLWARTVAEIEPEWAEKLAGDMAKRSYSEPHWSSASASVIAYEKVTLFGVPLVVERPVGYARIDPVAAREIFIRSGLVEGGWNPTDTHADHSFLAHNREVIERADELADRARGQGIIVDDDTVYAFYDARIPADVCSGASFDHWWRRQDRDSLEFSLELLAAGDEIDATASGFPDVWQPEGLAVSYVFEPGSRRDGVTVEIPLAQLNQLDPAPFSWQVPGLRTELATALIRTLPKAVRTTFVPAPDHARKALGWLASHEADRSRRFCDELGRALTAITGQIVDADAWRPDDVPSHLRLGFEIREPSGATRYSHDLSQLQRDLAAQVRATITRVAPQQASSTSWHFGTIPEVREVTRGGITAVGYPAVRDDLDRVSLVMETSPQLQAATHRRGLRRLLVLVTPDPTRWTVSHLSNSQKLALPTSPYADVPALLADARLKAVERCADAHADLERVRDEESFNRLTVEVRSDQADVMREIVATAAQICDLARQVRTTATGEIGREIQADLEDLVFDGFIAFTRDPWYDRVPAYLQSLISRARSDPARDASLAEPIWALLDEFDELCATAPPGALPSALDDIGFMIWELRVQTWAQRLGTRLPVSAKRIRKAMAAVGQRN